MEEDDAISFNEEYITDFSPITFVVIAQDF